MNNLKENKGTRVKIYLYITFNRKYPLPGTALFETFYGQSHSEQWFPLTENMLH